MTAESLIEAHRFASELGDRGLDAIQPNIEMLKETIAAMAESRGGLSADEQI